MADRSTRPKRAPKTREAALARAANKYAYPDNPRRWSRWPVTAADIVYHENATRILCETRLLPMFGLVLKFKSKPRPLWRWLGFRDNNRAAHSLGVYARGFSDYTALPEDTRKALRQLSKKLDELHAADGREHKPWARKHAIVLHALLTENV